VSFATRMRLVSSRAGRIDVFLHIYPAFDTLHSLRSFCDRSDAALDYYAATASVYVTPQPPPANTDPQPFEASTQLIEIFILRRCNWLLCMRERYSHPDSPDCGCVGYDSGHWQPSQCEP
jgi:hypothetical protein